ncbi:MAG: hypothetical protein EB165_03580 [Euryarchaeota archaeon]|jgi:hypothetical protein|nr:hypothetical protein [Euryarchaeota archaeon]
MADATYAPKREPEPRQGDRRPAARRKQLSKEQIEKLRQRYDALKGSTERVNFEGQWQNIGEVISPRKRDFVGMRTPGEKRQNKVYDSTGILANEMLAAGLHGMATNPSTQWFSLRLVGSRYKDEEGNVSDLNEHPQVQDYLSDIEQVMWQRIYQPGTNFTTAIHECYLDLGAFGTAILFIGQQDDGSLLFECRSLSECVISENMDGRVDTVFRITKYKVRQLMEMERAGEWEVSDETKQKFQNQKHDEDVEVLHVVMPREDRDPSLKGAANMPFLSCYFEMETCHCLAESGFPEFPYLVVRWSKYAGEIYGRSPGMTALPDVQMLQAMTLTKIKLMQKAADPPLWLRNDGFIGNQRTVPGGVNYFNGNPNEGVMLQPVSLQGLQHLVNDILQLREMILRTFFADIMRMSDRANMTATEVVQRTAEQMRLFGPLLGRLEGEMLGPLIERIFGILGREQLLPEAPEVIEGTELTVEYVSPIATAQKQQTATGVIQAMQLIVGTFGPELGVQIAMKEVDPRALFRWAWELFNNDPDLLTDEEQQDQADQIEQTKMGLQMGQPAATIAAQGARAFKDMTEGVAAGGMDLQSLIGNLQEAVANDPKARGKVNNLMRNVMDNIETNVESP